MAYFTGHGQRVGRFVEARVVQTKGRWAGKALQLEPWQKKDLDELYLVDSNGRFVYREALIGLPRKNGKSTLAAAIALYGLMGMGEQGAEVYCAAASKEQARIVFDQARGFVEASPKLRDWLRPQRNAILCPSNDGVFRVLSADAPLQHGLNPSLVVIDELWAHKDPELYYALTTGQLARIDPLVVSITTAGWDRESICWQVYNRGRALAEEGVDAMRQARFLHRWYQAPDNCDAGDPEMWKLANPSSWVNIDDLRLEYDRLPEFVFRRLHLNQWTDIEDAWISPTDWDACRGTPIIDTRKATYGGVDIGLKRDASAFLWAQWHESKGVNKLHVKANIRVPAPGQPLSAQDNRVQLKKEAKRFQALREIGYDPWQFTESAEMLADEGLPMIEYPQDNVRMAPATERVYELIREHRLVHDGNELLRAHVMAAVVGQTERGWRISKRKSRDRIDGAIALVIAADRAIMALVDRPPSKQAVFL